MLKMSLVCTCVLGLLTLSYLDEETPALKCTFLTFSPSFFTFGNFSLLLKTFHSFFGNLQGTVFLSIAIWANSLRPDRGFGPEPGEELRGQAKELLKIRN